MGVPTLGQTVEQRGLPDARLNPSAPDAAFQPQASGPDLSGVHRQIAEMQSRASEEADQVAVNTAQVQAHQLKAERLYGTPDDPTSGILNKKGLGAMAAIQPTIHEWDKGIAAITDGLQNDRQKALFQARASGMALDLSSTVADHAHREYLAHDKAQANTLLDDAHNDAVHNAETPDKVGHAVETTKAVLADYATRNGWSPEQLKSETDQHISKLHLGVIEQLSTVGNDRSAAAYFATNRDGFRAADLLDAEKIVGGGSTKQDILQHTADILSGKYGAPPTDDPSQPLTAPSATEALARAEKIPDLAVREGAVRGVLAHYHAVKQAQDLESEQHETEATKMVTSGAKFDELPVPLMQKINSAGQERLKRLDNRGDEKAYRSALNLASLAPGEFLKENFAGSKYRNLSDAQVNHLESLHQQASRRLESQDSHDEVQSRLSDVEQRRKDTHAASVADKLQKSLIAAEQDRVRTNKALAAASTPEESAAIHAHYANLVHLRGLVLATDANAPTGTTATRAQIEDVRKKGPGYADYLRLHGVNVPKVLPPPE